MTVLHNPFDATIFRLKGVCQNYDITFEGLPGDTVCDELCFDQVGAPTELYAVDATS